MYFWESVAIIDDSLVRVSMYEKMMILRDVLRFGVDFNRPLNHFLQQMTEDDEIH